MFFIILRTRLPKTSFILTITHFSDFDLAVQTRRRRRRVRLNSDLSGNDISDAGSGLESNLDNDAEGVDRVSDSPPDLSLSDL